MYVLDSSALIQPKTITSIEVKIAGVCSLSSADIVRDQDNIFPSNSHCILPFRDMNKLSTSNYKKIIRPCLEAKAGLVINIRLGGCKNQGSTKPIHTRP